MNVDELSPEHTPAEYARALADQLDRIEEIILGPTDQALAAAALRFYVPHLAADPAV